MPNFDPVSEWLTTPVPDEFFPYVVIWVIVCVFIGMVIGTWMSND